VKCENIKKIAPQIRDDFDHRVTTLVAGKNLPPHSHNGSAPSFPFWIRFNRKKML